MQAEKKEWDLIIKANSKWSDIDFKAIFHYKDLVFLFVKRDFVTTYKQTVLGPLWFFIQPLITSFAFTIIFGKIAKLSTDNIPPMLFYLSGITLWSYFSDCLIKSSSTFISNASIFGKVYFPRLITPISIAFSNLLKLGLQLVIFSGVYLYYYESAHLHFNIERFWVFPFLIILMGGLGIGFGILISSMTTKYRDLMFLVGFGVQLLMYGSSVVIPISLVSDNFRKFLLFNPVTITIEAFKNIFLGNGYFNYSMLAYAFLFMLVVLSMGVIAFSKTEKKFMDTV